jgi:hypothetical protein
MADNSFSIKSRPLVLGFFAVVGAGLGIGLIATGIFAPFGITLLGLIGAGFLLFLASMGVGFLINELIKGVEDFVQSRNQITPVMSDDPSKQPGIGVDSDPRNQKQPSVPSVSPFITLSAPKSKTRQELQADAQRVQKYFAEEFVLAIVRRERDKGVEIGGTAVEKIRFGGDRASKPLREVLKSNVYIVEKNGSVGVQIHERWGSLNNNWVSQAFQANVPKGNPMDHCPKPIKDLVDVINKEFELDIAQIIPALMEYEKTYCYRYSIEIGTDKISEILRKIDSAGQNLKSIQSQ